MLLVFFIFTGIEYADSLAFNPSKWLMVHFDCSALWLKDARALHRTFNVEPLYLQHENSGERKKERGGKERDREGDI